MNEFALKIILILLSSYGFIIVYHGYTLSRLIAKLPTPEDHIRGIYLKVLEDNIRVLKMFKE